MPVDGFGLAPGRACSASLRWVICFRLVERAGADLRRMLEGLPDEGDVGVGLLAEMEMLMTSEAGDDGVGEGQVDRWSVLAGVVDRVR